jgi:hypothetical protein
MARLKFVVAKPIDVPAELHTPDHKLWPVIHVDNVGISDHASIALCSDPYNAEWVAKALTRQAAVDEAMMDY